MTFDIDKNGIVNVTAKDLGTEKEQKITIESSSNLSDDDIDRMVKEAEANADEDKKRKEEVDLRNEADQLVFTTDKTIEDLGDKVSEEEKQEATSAKEALEEALKGDDLEEIKAKKDALQEKVQALSMKLYEEMAQQQQAAQGEEGQPSQDDDVVDADFTEVDDDKDNK